MAEEKYTVAELFAMLQDDDSWEKDPDKRAQWIERFKMSLNVWYC